MTNLRACAVFAITAIITAGLFNTSTALDNDISKLKGLMYSFEDTKMTVRDLAFYLATHNYDARPAEGYVALEINGGIYRLIPNGDAPGLFDIYPST